MSRTPRALPLLLQAFLFLFPSAFGRTRRRQWLVYCTVKNCTDERPTIFAGRPHELRHLALGQPPRYEDKRQSPALWPSTHLIVLDVVLQIFVTTWVEVVCEDATALLGGRERKRSDTRENVGDNILRLELVHQTRMLMV